jgi:predicted nucleic acid-binding protein
VLTAVIDSSTLICLVHLGLATQLSQFFDVVYVPNLVEREVNRKHRFRYRMKALYASGKFVKCKSANDTNRRILEGDKNINAGEADALTQAQERNILVFIGDERAARLVARNMDKRPVGTAGILARLHLEGLAGDPRELIQKLRRDLNCHISAKVVEDAIKTAFEPIAGESGRER